MEQRLQRFPVEGKLLNQPFEIYKLSHVNLYYERNPEAWLRFYIGMLGFKPVDVIDDRSEHALAKILGSDKLIFTRLGNDHHTFSLFPIKLRRDRMDRQDFVEAHLSTTIQQIAWEIGSYRQVMEAMRYVKESKIPIDFIGRRMPASNYNLYIWDPEGHRLELTWGMEQIGWTGKSKPMSFWNALRTMGVLPHGPVDPDEVEAQRVLEDTKSKGVRDDTLWRHSTDGYDFGKYLEGATGYDVGGLRLPRPFLLTRAGYVSIFAKDFDGLVNFYTRTLGFKLTEYADASTQPLVGSEGKGLRIAFLRARSEHHSLCVYPAELRKAMGISADTTLVHFAVETSNYSGLRESVSFFRKNGVEVLSSGRIFPGGEYAVDVLGPEGHVIRLFYGMDTIGWDGSARPKAQWKSSTELPATIES